LRISNATTTKMMTDVASDFIEPSEEDTLEYVKQHQFKSDTYGCKTVMESHTDKHFFDFPSSFSQIYRHVSNIN
jgi:hypothetical protein